MELFGIEFNVINSAYICRINSAKKIFFLPWYSQRSKHFFDSSSRCFSLWISTVLLVSCKNYEIRRIKEFLIFCRQENLHLWIEISIYSRRYSFRFNRTIRKFCSLKKILSNEVVRDFETFVECSSKLVTNLQTSLVSNRFRVQSGPKSCASFLDHE